jgi:uncharacterized protein YaaN involved in tellurite resistance
MQSSVLAKARADAAEIAALLEVSLPVPADTPVDPARLAARMAEIDVTNSATILRFGAKAQEELQEISRSMLAGVRAKDAGPAGEALSSMVTTLRGFTITAADGRSRPTFFERLFGRMTPIAKLLARFETVRGRIDAITERLLTHEQTLMTDVAMLDRLYAAILGFHDELQIVIAAGTRKIEILDGVDIPAAEAAAKGASDEDGILPAERLRDLRAARDGLERRVHDLKLTRQVTMQALPSIRLIQENDKSLITKINSTLVNTIPLWETQIAQALTIERSMEAAQAVRQAADLANALVTANSKSLRAANAALRRETDRGIFDIEAVKTANADLIATIEDSLQITEAGRARRVEAERELVTLESTLKTALRDLPEPA